MTDKQPEPNFFDTAFTSGMAVFNTISDAANKVVEQVSDQIKAEPATDADKEKKDAAIAAGSGAVAGAGVSLLLGGMGLAVGGTALAIGLPVVAVAGAVVGLAGYGAKKALESNQTEPKKNTENTPEENTIDLLPSDTTDA